MRRPIFFKGLVRYARRLLPHRAEESPRASATHSATHDPGRDKPRDARTMVIGGSLEETVSLLKRLGKTPAPPAGRTSWFRPTALMTVTFTCVFVTELAVMLLLSRFSGLATIPEALLDASLLAILLSPLVYVFLYRPLRRAKAELHTLSLENDRFADNLYVLLEGSPYLVMVVCDGRILYANPLCRERLGFSEAELYDPEFRIDRIFAEQAPGGGLPDGMTGDTDGSETAGETTLIAKDGTRITVILNETVMWFGDALAAVLTMADITTRRQLEDRLFILTTALEQSPMAVVITDADGVIEYANAEFAALTGYSQQEAVGQHTRILKSGKNPPEIYEDLWEFITTGRTWSGELINRRKDGTEYWAELVVAPVVQQGKGVTRFVGMQRDITALRIKSEALAASEWRLRKVLNSVHEGIAILDSEEKIEYCNAPMVQLLGYESSHELEGRSLREFLKEDLERLLQVPEENGRTRGRMVELTLVSATGEERTVEVTASPWIDDQGKHFGWVTAFLDVTERVRAAEERRQRDIEQHHEAKLAAVGSLAAGIAHEINTPIQFIGDNTQFLADAFKSMWTILQDWERTIEASDSSTPIGALREEFRKAEQEQDLPFLLEEVPQAIEQTLEGIERVRKIVLSMKEFAHPDSADKVVCDLNAMLDTTLTVARNEIKYVADVVREFDESLPRVMGYRGDLNQVFLNLLVNAAHAIADVVGDGSNGKGTITVKTYREGDCAVVAISDTGCGIPEEIQSRIFDPFFTTKEVGKGTGQGLAIAHKVVVEKHHGRLEFESIPGKGTTFYVRLPVETDSAADTTGASGCTGATRSETTSKV